MIGAVIIHSRWDQSASPATEPTAIQWPDLAPKEWDPTKRFRGVNVDGLRDGDPRSNQLLLDLRSTWDNAPTVSAMDGRLVRLAGYVVPLESSMDELKEFLLVPYFGACLHTPPPPANQIVHVIAQQPAQGIRTMDVVSVTGTITTTRQDSVMGVSGYSLSAVTVERTPRPP